MIEYNLAAEYASLVILVAILISFTRDYETKTLRYRFLKISYYVVLVSSLSTIVAMRMGELGIGVYTVLSYIANVVYFALISATTLCYLLYTVIILDLRYDQTNYQKKLAKYCIPYGIYLLGLCINFFTGWIFIVTEEEGYVRGPGYQFPFLLALVNVLLVVIVIIRRHKNGSKSVLKVMIGTAILAIYSLFMQLINEEMIMTGLLNTMALLSIHLYIQNSRKSMDNLTGLNNRIALRHKIDMEIDTGKGFSLYVFSLCGFKMINKRYDLEFGDRVLASVATYFVESFPVDASYRYSGDEFAVVLKKGERHNKPMIEKILKCFDQGLIIDQYEVALDMVYTRVDYGAFGYSVNDLISAADAAISELKQGTVEGRYLYDTSVVRKMVARNDMIEQLKYAIANDQLEVYYQPIYATKKEKFTHAEALVRMYNEDFVMLFPNSFIELAETTGLIVPMTYMILEVVCRDLRRMMDEQGENFVMESVSINFAYLQFSDIALEKTVVNILKKYKIPPSLIKIEITERTLISNSQVIENVIRSMTEMGIGFELDDFGVDYSNMYAFLKLSLNIIKIDRSLLLAAFESEKNKEFFEHLIAGVKATDRILVVEGIEEREQLDFIIRCGCEYVQGYYFSKPLRYDEFSKFMRLDEQTKYLKSLE